MPPEFRPPDMLPQSFKDIRQNIQESIQKNIRLIATDMDGTLTHHGRFTPDLLTALLALEQAGLTVLIVTGRSAGWVAGVVHYLPVAGAIAENGGVFLSPQGESHLLTPLPDPLAHRQALAQMFNTLRTRFPQLQEATDNRYRLTDWTFDIAPLSNVDLQGIHHHCQAAGWSFTYSTVQGHIKPVGQEKAIALSHLLTTRFPDLSRDQVITVGDSPNDASLFDPARFPLSVGVANVRHYLPQLPHAPRYITTGEEVAGFCELVRSLLDT
ncbi:MAG: HAD family hydrolase [Synechococcales bacterium]|nr:HAD family hydrolase [Synechococcales bacterium]